MAEMVGLVVGVVSLGVQLAESLQKVKRFYDAMKEAPERLADIIDEIESLSDILTELEGSSSTYATDLGPKMQRCVATCRKAVNKFSTYADSLENRLKRHGRRGSVKFASKSEDIEGVISRLESSKSNLVLAYMLYREAAADKRAMQMQQQMETLAVAQTSLLCQSPVVLASPNVPGSHLQTVPVLRSKNVARLSSPKWLSQSVWELAIERAISGWTFSLRSYRLIEVESPVVQACIYGDVVLLQQLFNRREASPFDRTHDDISSGRNLLMVNNGWPTVCRIVTDLLKTAVLFLETEIARLLITAAGGLVKFGSFHVEYCWNEWSRWAATKSNDVNYLRRHFAFLLEHCDTDEDFGHYEPTLDQVRTFVFGSTEDANLALFWNEVFRNFRYRSVDCRESVWSMLLDAVALDCQIEYLVGHRAVKYLNCEGFDLNSAAHSLAVACITSAISGTNNGRSNACILSKLVVEARHNGIDLLEHNHIAISPMLRLLHPELHNRLYGRDTGWKDLSAVLNAWLRLIQQLGVDLAAYGEEEWRLFQSIRRNHDCKRPWDAWHGHQPHSCDEQSMYKCDYTEYASSELDCRPALFSFSYGATLSDWNLWEIHPGDQYSGQFWAMVEQDGFPSEGKEFRVQEMPGGWLED